MRFHPEGVYPWIEECAQRLGRALTDEELLVLGWGMGYARRGESKGYGRIGRTTLLQASAAVDWAMKVDGVLRRCDRPLAGLIAGMKWPRVRARLERVRQALELARLGGRR